MQQIILIVHVLLCVSLVGLVLIQQGKGADIGASFGAGASQTVFGSQGSASFLFKITCVLAALFFATSLSLSYLASHDASQADQLQLPSAVTQQAPAKQTNKMNTESGTSKTSSGSQSGPSSSK